MKTPSIKYTLLQLMILSSGSFMGYHQAHAVEPPDQTPAEECETAAAQTSPMGLMDRYALTEKIQIILQRHQLFINGLAGEITGPQKDFIAQTQNFVKEIASIAGVDPQVLATRCSLSDLVKETISSYRFLAHSKHVVISFDPPQSGMQSMLDINLAGLLLNTAVQAAITGAQEGSKVQVSMSHSPSHLSVNFSAPGWDPKLLPAPPFGSQLSVSVVRSSTGARLIVSTPIVKSDVGE
jgi:hypothetical protein